MTTPNQSASGALVGLISSPMVYLAYTRYPASTMLLATISFTALSSVAYGALAASITAIPVASWTMLICTTLLVATAIIAPMHGLLSGALTPASLITATIIFIALSVELVALCPLHILWSASEALALLTATTVVGMGLGAAGTWQALKRLPANDQIILGIRLNLPSLLLNGLEKTNLDPSSEIDKRAFFGLTPPSEPTLRNLWLYNGADTALYGLLHHKIDLLALDSEEEGLPLAHLANLGQEKIADLS